MFAVYGLGFAAVFFTLGLLYVHAYRQRAALQLDALELVDTRYQIVDHCAVALVGILSCVVANATGPSGQSWAGWMYFLLGPLKTTIGYTFGKQRKQIERRLAERAV